MSLRIFAVLSVLTLLGACTASTQLIIHDTMEQVQESGRGAMTTRVTSSRDYP